MAFTFPNRNPFSSSFVRPGAVRFLSPMGKTELPDLKSIVHPGSRWQIIGPHGSGKSTFVVSLQERLQSADFIVHHHVLHSGNGTLSLVDPRSNARPDVVIVDGLEQLSRWSQWKLVRQLRRMSVTLVATAHCDLGYPTLYRTSVSLELLRAVVASLVVELPESLQVEAVTDELTLQNLLLKHGSNVREILFELYDVWESARFAAHV
ncbi:MAG: hypothetical protein KDB27_01210 [Planctomycetales bacterium]|nr:hypothetical protein [Planctomycetales bacterium]